MLRHSGHPAGGIDGSALDKSRNYRDAPINGQPIHRNKVLLTFYFVNYFLHYFLQSITSNIAKYHIFNACIL